MGRTRPRADSWDRPRTLARPGSETVLRRRAHRYRSVAGRNRDRRKGRRRAARRMGPVGGVDQPLLDPPLDPPLARSLGTATGTGSILVQMRDRGSLTHWRK